MEMPPTMPSRGFAVLSARRSPAGHARVISTPCPALPHSARTSRTCSAIIRRGTGLMAGSPGGTGSPGRVTTPTPGPRRNSTRPSGRNRTELTRRAPWVQSGSSPASLTTAAVARSSPSSQEARENVTSWPPGRRTAAVRWIAPSTRARSAPTVAAPGASAATPRTRSRDLPPRGDPGQELGHRAHESRVVDRRTPEEVQGDPQRGRHPALDVLPSGRARRFGHHRLHLKTPPQGTLVLLGHGRIHGDHALRGKAGPEGARHGARAVHDAHVEGGLPAARPPRGEPLGPDGEEDPPAPKDARIPQGVLGGVDDHGGRGRLVRELLPLHADVGDPELEGNLHRRPRDGDGEGMRGIHHGRRPGLDEGLPERLPRERSRAGFHVAETRVQPPPLAGGHTGHHGDAEPAQGGGGSPALARAPEEEDPEAPHEGRLLRRKLWPNSGAYRRERAPGGASRAGLARNRTVRRTPILATTSSRCRSSATSTRSSGQPTRQATATGLPGP